MTKSSSSWLIGIDGCTVIPSAAAQTSQKIEKFTRGMCDDLRDNIEDALAPIGEAFGIKFGTSGITYSEAVATLKLEMGVVSADGKVNTKMAEKFKAYANRWGLKVSDLGRKFTSRSGEVFELVGAKPMNRKYPIMGRSMASGVTYKFTVTALLVALKKYDNENKV